MHKPSYTLSLQLIQNENICKHKMTRKPQIPLDIRQKGHKQPLTDNRVSTVGWLGHAVCKCIEQTGLTSLQHWLALPYRL